MTRSKWILRPPPLKDDDTVWWFDCGTYAFDYGMAVIALGPVGHFGLVDKAK